MGRRTWIDSDIWSDTDDLTDDERLLYLYLLTNEQRNIAGYYKLNLKYVAIDFGMTEAKIEMMLARKQKYWSYDQETKQVLIPKFTRYNIVRSKQQLSAMNAELNKLKPCPLHKEFIRSFTEVNGIGAEELIDDRFKRSASI